MSTSACEHERTRRRRTLRHPARPPRRSRDDQHRRRPHRRHRPSRSLSRYENGRFVPTPERLDALLDTYHAPDAVRTHLHKIVANLRAENRRVVVHRRNAPAFQRRIRDIEASPARPS